MPTPANRELRKGLPEASTGMLPAIIPDFQMNRLGSSPPAESRRACPRSADALMPRAPWTMRKIVVSMSGVRRCRNSGTSRRTTISVRAMKPSTYQRRAKIKPTSSSKRWVEQVGNRPHLLEAKVGQGTNLAEGGFGFIVGGFHERLDLGQQHLQGREILGGGVVQLAGKPPALGILEAQQFAGELAQFIADPALDGDVAKVQLDHLLALLVIDRSGNLNAAHLAIGGRQDDFHVPSRLLALKKGLKDGGGFPALQMGELAEGLAHHQRRRQLQEMANGGVGIGHGKFLAVDDEDAIRGGFKQAAVAGLGGFDEFLSVASLGDISRDRLVFAQFTFRRKRSPVRSDATRPWRRRAASRGGRRT